MKIEDLQETVQLAHLTMDDQALTAAFPAFEQILGFFAAMQAADKDTEAFPDDGNRFPGTSLPVDAKHFRQDNSDADNFSRGLDGNLFSNAGEQDGRFVVIPNVL